jgi:hypothetical protein
MGGATGILDALLAADKGCGAHADGAALAHRACRARAAAQPHRVTAAPPPRPQAHPQRCTAATAAFAMPEENKEHEKKEDEANTAPLPERVRAPRAPGGPGPSVPGPGHGRGA